MKNRLKKGESTLCTFTHTGQEIMEGDILGFGDNYSCVVLYDKWEAKFVAIEFGYQNEEGYLYRQHDIIAYTRPWEVLGNIDNADDFSLLKDVPENFDYNADVEEYYVEKDSK